VLRRCSRGGGGAPQSAQWWRAGDARSGGESGGPPRAASPPIVQFSELQRSLEFCDSWGFRRGDLRPESFSLPVFAFGSFYKAAVDLPPALDLCSTHLWIFCACPHSATHRTPYCV
jgi:hypothetical protein